MYASHNNLAMEWHEELDTLMLKDEKEKYFKGFNGK
jgi:hypothetical protein